MIENYKIEVHMTARTWDNYSKPYFWTIYKFNNKDWINSGSCGWEKTPAIAWSKALQAFNELQQETLFY